MGTTTTRAKMIELYIQVLESRIADRREELSKVAKNDHARQAVLEGMILGFEASLRTFLILNDR